MSKWRCVSRPDNKSRNFTVGKVYELDDNTDELIADDGFCFGGNHVHDDCGGTIAFLQRHKIMFEEVKNMFNMSMMENGALVKFRNGRYGVAMVGMYNGESRFVMLAEPKSTSLEMDRYTFDNMTYNAGYSTDSDWDIMEVCMPPVYPDLCDPEREFKGANIVYRREQPKELTVSQIEEILGYKIKVVADKEG